MKNTQHTTRKQYEHTNIQNYSQSQQLNEKYQTYRVSTNLTEQISRRFPGLQEGFQEKSRTCLHCFGLLCTESTTFNGSCLPGTVFVLADTYRAGMLTPEIMVILFTRYCQSDLVPFYDWKPMRSSILHKNFQEDH